MLRYPSLIASPGGAIDALIEIGSLEVPTWTVSSRSALALFNALVPALHEVYAQLFCPCNPDGFDQFMEKTLVEERAKTAALLGAHRDQGAAR